MLVTKEIGFVPNDTTITSRNPIFIDASKPPFRLYGFCESFRRLPQEVATATSEAVANLSETSAGCRLRFKTDSDYLVIHAEIKPYDELLHYSVADIGFDVFIMGEDGPQFAGAVIPSQGKGKTYLEGRIMLKEGMKDLLVSFPLFAKINSIAVALREGSTVECGGDYAHKTPIVFYGSSIVHGVGAGRPSSNYPAIISRHMDTDFINLGFSGAAKAEPAVLDYIGTLPMSVFVYDYDHNAPTPEYYEETHYAGYLRFRAAQPNTPVIMATRVDYYNNVEENERYRKTAFESYRRGIEAGDRHLYLIDGARIYEPEYRNESTLDGCHPNDIGYLQMAKVFSAAIRRALSEAENS